MALHNLELIKDRPTSFSSPIRCYTALWTQAYIRDDSTDFSGVTPVWNQKNALLYLLFSDSGARELKTINEVDLGGDLALLSSGIKLFPAAYFMSWLSFSFFLLFPPPFPSTPRFSFSKHNFHNIWSNFKIKRTTWQTRHTAVILYLGSYKAVKGGKNRYN